MKSKESFSEKERTLAEDMGCSKGTSNVEALGTALSELGEDRDDIHVVTSDCLAGGAFAEFRRRYPNRFHDVGIAEQCLVGVASGLASTGKAVVAVGHGPFLVTRAADQIRSLASIATRLCLVGAGAGYDYGALGKSHFVLHDYAIVSAISDAIYYCPSDSTQVTGCLEAFLANPAFTYMRTGRRNAWVLPEAGWRVAQATRYCEGDDITIVAVGETAVAAIVAARLLRRRGIAACVISLHCLAPADYEEILHATQASGHLLVLEEHARRGGFFEACASRIVADAPGAKIRGVSCEPTDRVAPQHEHMCHAGLTPTNIMRRVCKLLA